MNENGFEVDMLAVGDGDAILATQWTNGAPIRVLIDGGNADAADTVRAFLLRRGIRYVDHVVCTHPHDDHAAGLVELLKDQKLTFGRLWMHVPWQHIDTGVLMRAWQQGKSQHIAKILIRSLETQINLAKVAAWRGIATDREPFAGEQIGPLFVCGPKKDFYEALLLEFSNLEKLAAYESAFEQEQREDMIEDLLEEEGDAGPETGLLEVPKTSPENDSATILWAKQNGVSCVFTSDAGVAAMDRAKACYQIGGCSWMQIPHHGSRHNITARLIQYFSPQSAAVSAEGNRDHPRKAVVNAFKQQGANVFSTHYPTPLPLWFHTGTVPLRSDYGTITPLYEAKP